MKTISSSSVNTPLGQFDFSAIICPEESGINAIITNQVYNPNLPNGMSVSECRVIILKIQIQKPYTKIIFDCTYNGLSHNFIGASSGEDLEASEWSNGKTIVTVGTEDYFRLKKRLLFKSLDDSNNCSVVNENNKLSINLLNVDQNEISLHYIIAWNELPEPIKHSTWFAVDVKHDLLFSKVQ